MENLTCKGLSAAHRRMLIKCITEEIGSIPEPVEIEFMEPIRRKQYSSLWYGGQIAAIRVHGCVFEVHALGDVYAWLYDKSDRDRELLYVKDKNNSGRFGSDIQPYLKTDRALVCCHSCPGYFQLENSRHDEQWHSNSACRERNSCAAGV